ncbi:hypothetical protein Zmor_005958 [Zophobas morio]|uniref:Uncharacterized protein n=1 Tax=Zophobas morio TaxID=2755281 RepID=A0AA38MN55_9CUCU|nr:hypothetical protein Zmor_005958 [Zophobas morio]
MAYLDGILHLFIVNYEENLQRIRQFRLARRRLRDAANPFDLPNFSFLKLFRLSKDAARYLINTLAPHMNNVLRQTGTASDESSDLILGSRRRREPRLFTVLSCHRDLDGDHRNGFNILSRRNGDRRNGDRRNGFNILSRRNGETVCYVNSRKFRYIDE